MTQHISFKSPTDWHELTADQYAYYLKLRILNRPIIEIMTYIFFRYNKIVPLQQFKDGWNVKYKKLQIFLHDWQIHSCVSSLKFLQDEIPKIVIRLYKMRGVAAVNEYLVESKSMGAVGLTFGDYLRIDNNYQLYLDSQDGKYVSDMAEILYPGLQVGCLKSTEELNVLTWWASLKLFLKNKYEHLFISSSSATEQSDYQDATNGQIRALTGGDVTKEDVVLDINVHRALTELNAKALEVKELKEKYKNV